MKHTQDDIELYGYLLSIGIKKSEAYRKIVDCEGISNEHIAVKAWRLANSPDVVNILATEQDNLHIKYSSYRHMAMETLATLAANANSEKVRSDSANALLTQTSRLKGIQIDLNHNVKTELSMALDEFRQIAKTPHSVSTEVKKDVSNNFQESQKLTLNESEPITIDGEIATRKHVVEQTEGLNPSTPNKGAMGNTGKTGRFRQADGKFITNKDAGELL